MLSFGILIHQFDWTCLFTAVMVKPSPLGEARSADNIKFLMNLVHGFESYLSHESKSVNFYL